MKWMYRVRPDFQIPLDKVEVVSSTRCFAVVKGGRREALRTNWQSYFETLEEAVSWLISVKEAKVSGAESVLAYAKSELGVAKSAITKFESGSN